MENSFLRESNAIEGVHDEQSFVDAKDAWEFLLSQPKLTKGVILTTHKKLMANQKIKFSEMGVYRTQAVYIGSEEMLHYSMIESAIEHWMFFPNNFNFDSWKESHIIFENIHPFIDGNGRIGRMLMNWQRLKLGLPILVIYDLFH